MTVVLVHGSPETWEIWTPLRSVLDRDTAAVALPGFGVARPRGFAGTKDAYARWLAEALVRFDEPVDVVGHDIGALLTMRVASAFDVPLRSWAVDVADIFHAQFVWPERVRKLQTPGVGEEMLRAVREAREDDPESTASRLVGAGVPQDLAKAIGTAHDEVMSRSILDFYRSAVPNVSAGGGKTFPATLGRAASCCSCLTRPKSRRCRWRLPGSSAPRQPVSTTSITAGWLSRPRRWQLSSTASGPRWSDIDLPVAALRPVSASIRTSCVWGRLGCNREAAAYDFRSAVRKFAPFEPSASTFGSTKTFSMPVD